MSPPSVAKAHAPIPKLLVQMTEADLDDRLDVRDQRLIDAIAEMIGARPPKILLDPGGVCQLLGVTSPTIRKMREEGMPHVRVGESYRYDSDAVLEWLRQRTEGQR